MTRVWITVATLNSQNTYRNRYDGLSKSFSLHVRNGECFLEYKATNISGCLFLLSFNQCKVSWKFFIVYTETQKKQAKLQVGCGEIVPFSWFICPVLWSHNLFVQSSCPVWNLLQNNESSEALQQNLCSLSPLRPHCNICRVLRPITWRNTRVKGKCMRLFSPSLLPLLSQTSHIFPSFTFTCLEIHDEKVSDGGNRRTSEFCRWKKMCQSSRREQG